jgi:hypothetical protein
MKNKFSVLDYDLSHFTESIIIDANIIPFEGISNIRSIYLTSDIINLNKCNFEFTLNFENWEEKHFLSTDKIWPLFSNELIQIIKKHFSGLIIFPVKLIDKKGNEHQNKFSIVQIPSIKNLVNLELSIFKRKELFPDFFSTVDKMVFNNEIETEAIFRIHEYPLVLILTDELSKDISRHNFKDLLIIEMEDYNWNYL